MKEGSSVSSIFRAIMLMHEDNVKGTDMELKIKDIKKAMELDLRKKFIQNKCNSIQIINKDGEQKNVVIDDNKNTGFQTQIAKILQKNKCTDIFRDTEIEDKNKMWRMYEEKTEEKFIREKRLKNNSLFQYNRL